MQAKLYNTQIAVMKCMLKNIHSVCLKLSVFKIVHRVTYRGISHFLKILRRS